MDERSEPDSPGQEPDGWSARIARASLMGRKWGADTPRKLRHHLRDWDDDPRKRLCLGAAAIDAASPKNRPDIT